ncbi:hypothetical protein NQ318_009039 [Aromia moschata]|uniref:RecA family profile 1 domain-containing protein n=1 Tax=Aromia moschata TaxID=1265417 RepID=A0AAV8YU15_9CUCU|nr:hypothetical protein NQ318_009039 [Aromia moschata]
MSRLSPNMHAILKADVIELLNSKQIYTVRDFIKTESRLLEKLANLTFRETLDVKNFLIKTYSAQPKNGFEYYKHILLHSAIIETGVKSIDGLLQGGLYTANIYEICGLPATGKTLFCLTLVKNVICNMKENIYYLDTKQDFSARKLKQMLDSVNDKQELVNVLNRTLFKTISTKQDLIRSLLQILDQLNERFNLRVVVIDSLPALYLQSSDHTENNSFLNYMTNILRFMTVEYNVVIVITNLITLWNEGSFKTQDEFKERVSCGKYWYNIPNVRLKFQKVSDKKCKVSLMKSVKIMPDVRECDIELTQVGIR